MARATLFSKLLSQEDLEPNLVESEVIGNVKNEEDNSDEIVSQGHVYTEEQRKAFLNNTTATMESYSLSKEFFGLFGNKEERRKKLCYGIPPAETTINVEYLKNKLETIKKLDIPSSFNSYKSLAPIVLLATFKYNTANIAATIKAMANNIRVFATAIKTDELSPDKVVRGLKYIRSNISNIAARTNYGNEEIFAIDVWRNNTYEEVIFRSQTIEVTTVGNAFNNPDPKQLNNTVIAGGWSFHKDDKFIGSWFSVDEWSKGYDKQDGHMIKIANIQELIKAIEELIKVYEKDYKDINSFKDLAYTKNSENYPRGYNYGRFIKEMYVEVSDAAYNIAKMTINMLLLSVNESTEELTALENMKGCDISSHMFRVKPGDQLTNATQADTHMEDTYTDIDTDVSTKLNETVDNLNDAIDSNDEVLMTKVGEATVEMLQELRYEYKLPLTTTISKEDFIYDPKGCCKKLCTELSNEFFGWFGSKTKNDKVTPRTQAVDFRSINNDFKDKLNTLIDRYTSLSSNKDISTKKVFISKEQDNKFLIEGLGKDTSWYTAIDYMLFNLSILDKARRTDLGPDDIYDQLKDLSSLLTPRAKKDADYKPSKNNKYYALIYSKNKISNSGAEGMLPVAEYRKSEDTNEPVLYMDSHYAQDIISFSVDPIGGAVVDSVCKQSGFGYVIKDALKFLKELKKYVDNKSKDIKNKSINSYTTDQIETERYHATINDAFDNCAIGIISLILAMDSCIQEIE